MKNPSTSEASDLIEQAFPQVRFLLLALDGDSKAQHWLDSNSPGTGLFARLLGGDATVLPKLNNGTPGRMDDLFELVDNDDLARLFQERRPALQLLFGALRGDAEAARALKRDGPAYYKHLTHLRQAYARYKKHEEDGPLEESAADMGCLVGEMHLRAGEYEKAIEAFTRAIETAPSADLYEGRARAYRGLAELDLERAQLTRSRG